MPARGIGGSVAASAQLVDVLVPQEPEGVVLVLHGGGSRQGKPTVSPTQLSVLRMVPIARRIARSAHRRLAVFRVLNSHRGWDTAHTPVGDAQWALDEAARRIGGPLPSCLVGHSLGGRAAILAAAWPGVRGAVALAPWVYPTDVPSPLGGRRLLIVHGSHDRVASPKRSAALARNLARGAEVGYVTVVGGEHAMLRRHRVFGDLAAKFVAMTLLGERPTGVLAEIGGGRSWARV
jgi:predicted esterase